MDKWLRNNNIIRIVAVLVGLLLWVIVRLDVQNSTGPSQPTTISQTYTNVSVQVIGLDEERFTLMSYEPQRVTLTVVGTASSLRRVNDNYRVLLNLTDVQPGEHLVSLTHEGFPSNVQVVLDPPNVAVKIDEKERKELPVTIELSGAPAEGYTAGEPIVQPDRVNVTVESSLADGVASVVGLVDIGGAKETVRREVRLVALDPDGKEVDIAVTPAVVEVQVPVTSPFKTVPLRVSLEGAPPAGFAVESFAQSVQEVTVYGPQSTLAGISFYDGFGIDLSRITESRTFEFELPRRGDIERVEPAAATATVTIVPAETRTIEGVPLTLNGRRAEYEYALTVPGTEAVDVTVEAAPSVAARLTSGSMAASVDVSGLAPGEHQVQIVYGLPSFVELAEGNALAATIVVTEASEEASAEPDTDGGSEGGNAGGDADGAGESGASAGAGAGNGTGSAVPSGTGANR